MTIFLCIYWYRISLKNIKWIMNTSHDPLEPENAFQKKINPSKAFSSICRLPFQFCQLHFVFFLGPQSFEISNTFNQLHGKKYIKLSHSLLYGYWRVWKEYKAVQSKHKRKIDSSGRACMDWLLSKHHCRYRIH